jgi:hypothetical protein
MATQVEFDRSGHARLPQAAISVHAPGWSGTARVIERATSATGTRGDGDDIPLAALEGADINDVAYVEIEAAPGQDGGDGTRSEGATGAINVSLDTPRPDHDYALLQRDPSGLLHWVFPEQMDGEGLSFTLAEPTEKVAEADGRKRGAITGGMRIGARIVSWATDGVTGKLARDVAGAWERRRRPYFLKAIAHDGTETDPDWEKLRSGPILLLIHGTFSTPSAGFNGLFGSPEFKAILAHYEGRCLAFAHPSMNTAINDNVNHLIAQLSKVLPHDATLDVDVVCHSRGGLVSRAIAVAAKAGKLSLRVHKLVMVAAPNRGTPLSDATHWKEFIDRYTNLLVTLPDTISTVSMEGVLCLVKIIGGGAVQGLPGLAAMLANGEQLAALSKEDLGDVDLYAIVADFRPETDSPMAALLQKGGKAAVDAFFAEPNDLVVPTAGSHDLKGTKHFPLPKDRIHEFSGGSVNHVNFFLHREVRQTLANLLTPSAGANSHKPERAAE